MSPGSPRGSCVIISRTLRNVQVRYGLLRRALRRRPTRTDKPQRIQSGAPGPLPGGSGAFFLPTQKPDTQRSNVVSTSSSPRTAARSLAMFPGKDSRDCESTQALGRLYRALVLLTEPGRRRNPSQVRLATPSFVPRTALFLRLSGGSGTDKLAASRRQRGSCRIRAGEHVYIRRALAGPMRLGACSFCRHLPERHASAPVRVGLSRRRSSASCESPGRI
jgi:hypothetical protein